MGSVRFMPWPCHAQALLAPEPFAATAQKGAVLVAAEVRGDSSLSCCCSVVISLVSCLVSH